MSTRFIHPEFLDAELGDWRAPNTRPEVTGVYRICPPSQEPTSWAAGPAWSHYDTDARVNIAGTEIDGVWGRAYSDPEDVKTAEEGGCNVNQDRHWAGLIEEPFIRMPMPGQRVEVLQDLDAIVVKGAVIDDLVMRGPYWEGTITSTTATYNVKVSREICGTPFTGDTPPAGALAQQMAQELEDDDEL